MNKISVVGGWPQNDSIIYMAFSEDVGETRVYDDIFPGKIQGQIVIKRKYCSQTLNIENIVPGEYYLKSQNNEPTKIIKL